MSTLRDLLKLLFLILDLIKWAQVEYGPDWDQALASIGKGFALLPKAKTPEERDAALDAISRGFNPSRK